MRVGIPKLRARVVNLTEETDVRNMIRFARSDKRVTIDLDEAVFCGPGDAFREAPLPFPLSKTFPEPLRQGIPALFRYLSSRGYDIWVYSSEYRSVDYIRLYFAVRRLRVLGIVTGTRRRAHVQEERIRILRKWVEGQYRTTLHIDRESVVRIRAGGGGFEERSVRGNERPRRRGSGRLWKR